MEEKVTFTNFESKNYMRSFANIVYITQSPAEEVGLDFFEEYVDSVSMMNCADTDPDDDSLYIKREKKFSVLMSKEEAVFMAQRILEKFGEQEIDEEEGELE